MNDMIFVFIYVGIAVIAILVPYLIFSAVHFFGWRKGFDDSNECFFDKMDEYLDCARENHAFATDVSKDTLAMFDCLTDGCMDDEMTKTQLINNILSVYRNRSSKPILVPTATERPKYPGVGIFKKKAAKV